MCCSVLQSTPPPTVDTAISKTNDAVCCSVLQCVAVCCSVLQCVAVCCSVSHCRHSHFKNKQKLKWKATPPHRPPKTRPFSKQKKRAQENTEPAWKATPYPQGKRPFWKTKQDKDEKENKTKQNKSKKIKQKTKGKTETGAGVKGHLSPQSNSHSKNGPFSSVVTDPRTGFPHCIHHLQKKKRIKKKRRNKT